MKSWGCQNDCHPNALDISYDFIIIGDIGNCYQLAQQLSDLSISEGHYQVCTGQRIKAVTVVQVVD